MWAAWVRDGKADPGYLRYLAGADTDFHLQEHTVPTVTLFQVMRFGPDGPALEPILLTQEQVDIVAPGHYQKTGRAFKFACDQAGMPITFLEEVQGAE